MTAALRSGQADWAGGERRRIDRRQQDLPFDGPDRRQRARRARDADAGPGWIYAIPANHFELAPVDAWPSRAAYRAFEIAVSALALLLLLPVMLLEAAWIRLDSPGPAVFHQRRVARSRRVRGHALADRPDLRPAGPLEPDAEYLVPETFAFIKFRTMRIDARERFPHLYRYTYRDREHFLADRFKRDDDPRVTRAGRWLRRSTLDELPNFWCVLKGDMALVGPRPELPDLLVNYEPHEMAKFAVRPGVTGLAQINGRGNLDFNTTLAWDLEYVRTRSVSLDLRILLRTVWLVLTRHGAF